MLKVYKLAQSLIPIALVQQFDEFPKTILEIHGKDLQVSADPSRTGTPAPSNSSVTAAAKAAVISVGRGSG